MSLAKAHPQQFETQELMQNTWGLQSTQVKRLLNIAQCDTCMDHNVLQVKNAQRLMTKKVILAMDDVKERCFCFLPMGPNTSITPKALSPKWDALELVQYVPRPTLS